MHPKPSCPKVQHNRSMSAMNLFGHVATHLIEIDELELRRGLKFHRLLDVNIHVCISLPFALAVAPTNRLQVTSKFNSAAVAPFLHLLQAPLHLRLSKLKIRVSTCYRMNKWIQVDTSGYKWQFLAICRVSRRIRAALNRSMPLPYISSGTSSFLQQNIQLLTMIIALAFNRIQPDSTGFNRIQPDSTGFNRVRISLGSRKTSADSSSSTKRQSA